MSKNRFLKTATSSYIFDSAVDGTAVATYTLDGDAIPDNAIVTDAFYDVLTTFATAGADAGTIALTVQSAGDIKAAIAVSAAGDVWDAGLHSGLPGNFALDGNAMSAIEMAAAKAASRIKLTANRKPTLAVAGQALTAGKLVLYVTYQFSSEV